MILPRDVDYGNAVRNMTERDVQWSAASASTMANSLAHNVVKHFFALE